MRKTSRQQKQSAAWRSTPPKAPMEFLELPGRVVGAAPGNVVELRDSQGTRLRVEFQDADDASALALMLWEDRG
jgi:hypothetical protein